ncbi:MAG TPA: DUF885 domain-containing protein [Myxococcales bacterium]|nr:DUF885 domain-containing protein [Myxococcales bacterium]
MNPFLLALLVAAASPAQRLHALFEREWQWRLRNFPEFASSAGVHDFDDRLTDESPQALAQRDRDARAFLQELDAIGPVPAGEQANAEMFRIELADRVGAYRFGEQVLRLNADSGFHSGFALIWKEMPFQTAKQYDNYLARLRAFPHAMDQNIELLREGVKRGMTVPKATLAGTDTAARMLVTEPEKSALWNPFAHVPPQIPAADRERIVDEGRKVLAEQVMPAYAKFADFLTNEYLPGARETLGAIALPDGKAYYQFLIRRFTTLDLPPEQIHQIGLDQVKAIRAEMDAVIAKVGFKGAFAAFVNFLRTDPRFYAKSPEDLLMHAAWIAKQMDGKLPSLFKTLPRQPYTVRPVPEFLAPKYTSGRYSGAPIGGTEPGEYWVNTYALDKRPLYNLEALTFHEAVPGHHLQIALSKEATGVPEFRRHLYYSAFGEGWGLYSEWLGKEAGFYTDPYSDFGRLTYAMWRACRLVVDTGVHTMGWTRQQMIDFMAQNTALPLHEVETETDRYISWPAQALSYELGYLKLRELRARAEKELGARFDVRAFHDAVLAQGSVPLPLLEKQVDRFISQQAQKR